MPKSIDPEIKQGYWARVRAIEMIVEQFIEVRVCCLSVREGKQLKLFCAENERHRTNTECRLRFRYVLLSPRGGEARKCAQICGGALPSFLLAEHTRASFSQVDFSSVAAKKIGTIMRPNGKVLKETLEEKSGALEGGGSEVSRKSIFAGAPVQVSSSRCDMHAPPYHLLGADLRQEKELVMKLNAAEIDYGYES